MSLCRASSRRATIGISVIRGFDDPVVTDGEIDTDVDAILDILLRDLTFVGVPPAGEGLFEGVTRIDRLRLFAQQGETYFVETRLELDFEYRALLRSDHHRAPHWHFCFARRRVCSAVAGLRDAGRLGISARIERIRDSKWGAGSIRPASTRCRSELPSRTSGPFLPEHRTESNCIGFR